jgi:hypothetical protein
MSASAAAFTAINHDTMRDVNFLRMGLGLQVLDQARAREVCRNPVEMQLGLFVAEQQRSSAAGNNPMLAEWRAFMEQVPLPFGDKFSESFDQKLLRCQEFIDQNRRKPSTKNGVDERKLAFFLDNQMIRFAPRHEMCLKHKRAHAFQKVDVAEQRAKWEAFMQLNKPFFLSKEEKFRQKLAQLQAFILENGRMPSYLPPVFSIDEM